MSDRWQREDTMKDDMIWENTVDQGKFATKVIRTGKYTGRLQVKVVATNESLLDEEVGLAYDAIFGPDVDDVAEWQEKCLVAIDNYLVKQS